MTGTDVVEMSALSPRAELLAPLRNTTVNAYRDHLAATSRDSVSRVIAGAEEEAQKLKRSVAAKREEMDTFRTRHDIVSVEPEENQVLARVRGVATSLNTADERVAVAGGRLRSINEAISSGRTVTRSRDDPTLANLEQRASSLRQSDSGMDAVFNLMPVYSQPFGNSSFCGRCAQLY